MAAMSNGRCRMHGGMTPSGPASPQYRTGRYSKVLPARLAGRYEEALANPDLLALRDDIAVIDARLAEMLGDLDASGGAATWEALAEEMNAFEAALKTSDTRGMTRGLTAMRRLVGQGAAEGEKWEQIALWMERKRKLSETERRLLVDMQQVITAEKAMVLMAALVDIVRRHVDDRSILAAIVLDVDRLLAAGGAP